MAKAPDYGSYIPDANDPVFVTQAKAAQLAKEQPLYASGQGTPIFNNPGGIDGYVQFNSASSFGGDVGFTYNNKTRSVNILGNLNVGGFLNSKFYTNFSNLRISGGSEGDVIFTDGEGNLSWGNLDNYTTNAELTARFTSFQQGNVNFTGANVSLGNVSNLHISGGSPNFILSTDGNGNLSWIEETGGGPNRFSIYNGTSNVAVPDTDGNVFVNVNDEYQWVYNTDGELLAGGQFVALQGELTARAGYTFDETSRDTGMYSDSDGQLKFKANDRLVAFYTDNDVHLYTKSADYLTTYDWHLDRTGNLTLPTGGAINYSNGVSILSGLGGGGDSFDQSLNTDDDVTFNSVGATTINVSQINGTNPGDELIIQANNLNWTFGTEGNLTLPSNTARINYANGTNILDGLGGDGTGLSVTDFGEGFSLTASNKIVTNKLYSTNETQPTQHYRLELDTNGVVVLPDGSIINGSTIRGVAGTGELNYTGITIGPNSGDAEKTWMWVDHENAYISTNNFVNTWTFESIGILTLPSYSYIETTDANLKVGSQGTVTIRSNAATLEGIKTWTFDNNGNFILPVDGDILDSTGNSVLGISPSVPRSDTAPVAANGQLWFNTLEGRMYIKYDGAWVDAAPLMTPAPELNPEFSTITFPDASVQTTAALGDRLVNGNREVVLNSNGSLLVAEDIILPQTGRIIKDCNNSGGTTSQRWVNIPTDTEVELIRAYTGDPDASGGLDVERAKISVEWQTPDKTGLSIAAFDDGDEYKWEFNGDGTTQFPAGIIKAPPGDNTISMQSQNSKNFVTVSDSQVLISAENTTEYNWAFGTNGVLTLPSSSYLESSDNNLKVGSQSNVIIRSNAGGGAGLKAWTFGTDGTTQFPTNMSIDYSGGNVQFPRIIADSGKAFSVQGQGNTGSAAMSWTVDPDAAGQYAAVGVTKEGGDNLAKVILQAQSNSGDAGTTKTWQFNETGTTKFPDGTILAPAGQNITMQSDQYAQLVYQNANLTVAPDTSVASNFYVAQNSATLDIVYRDGNSNQQQKSWLWSLDGSLTLPAGGTITEGGGLTGAIRLTPAGGDNSNQALLIYPTAGAPDGDHIHLTAGGGSTELYLGNDLHYVKLVDGGNIELRAATANLSAQASWQFDTTGNIDARQALGIKVPNTVPTDVAVINSTTGSWESNPRSALVTTGGSGSGLTVNVTQTDGYASTIAIDTAGTGYTNGDLITVTSGTSNATFTIVIAGRNTWQFGNDGNLTVPGSFINDTSIVLSAPAIFNICTISTAGSGYNTGSSLKATTGGSGTGMTVGIGYGISNQLTNVDVVDPGTGYVDGDVITVSGGTGGTFVISKYNESANQANNNTIQTDFTFANNTVTLPIYGEIATNASMTLTTNLANTGNTNSWTFDNTGNLTLPGNLIIAGNANVFGTNASLLQTTDNRPLLELSSGANGAVSSLWVEDIGNVGTSNIAAVYANPTVGSKIVRIAVGQNGVGSGPNLWDFGTDGNLTLPGNIRFPNGANIAVPSGTPRTNAIAITNATELLIGTNTATTSSLWTFGIDGSTIFPDNTVKGYCFTTTNTVINYIPQAASFMYTDSPILRLISTIGGTWYIKGPGLVGWKQITSVQDNGGVALIVRIGSGAGPMGDGSEFHSGGYLPTSPDLVYTISQYLDFDLKAADKTWMFDKDGNITLPTNTSAINYANGQSILDGLGGGSSYGDSNVANYLPTYTGNVSAGLATFSNVQIGGNLNYADSANLIIVEDKDGFADIIAQNKNSGGNASMNIVLINDNPGNVYMALGVNSSNFTPLYNTLFEIPDAGYVSHSTTQVMGPVSAESGTSKMYFTYNSGNLALELNDFGAIGWGASYDGNLTEGNFGNVGQILTSAGNSSPPTWNNDVSVAGNITGGNIRTAGVMSSTGNLTSGNILTGGLLSATGNITGNYFIGNGSQLTDITVSTATTAATVTTNAQPNITSVGTLSGLTVGPNSSIVLSGTSGYVKANSLQGTDGTQTIYLKYGSVAGAAGIATDLTVGTTGTGNLTANGTISASGNITGNYILGNGSQLTGITTSYANANVATFLDSFGSNNISTSGNVSVGNLLLSGTAVGYGVISPTIGSNTSPVTGAISAATTGTATTILTAAIPAAGTWEITAQVQGSLLSGQQGCFALFDGAGALVANTESKAGYIGSGTTFQGQGTSVWRVTTVGAVNYTVRGYGPGATGGFTVLNGSDGRTNVSWSLLSAPVTLDGMTVPTNISVVGNVDSANVLATGYMSAAGNITGNYILGNGSQLTGITATTAATVTTDAQPNITSVGTLSSLSISGNITSGNILTGGLLSATGNITGGNIRTAGVMSSTGNLTSGNILTGGLLSATGNITGGNLITSGLLTVAGNISAGGNIIGASSNVSLVAGSYTWTFDNTSNAAFPGNLSVTGNITGNTNGFAIGYRDVPQVAASNATIGLTDAGKHFYSTTAGNFTLTIPNNATTTFSTGTAISIVVQAAGNILVNAASGVTLYMAGNSTAANRVVGTYGMATIMKVASDTWFINGTGVS